MLLFAALMQTAGTLVAPGQTAAWGAFGAMLLRDRMLCGFVKKMSNSKKRRDE